MSMVQFIALLVVTLDFITMLFTDCIVEENTFPDNILYSSHTYCLNPY